jgi:FlaA1/EpsC-like NDP-sugar epimerase
MILDMIEKNPNITQREMSKVIGIAVSMINFYLDTYEKNKLIIRKKHSTKTVEYFVTKKGSERRKVLNIGYLKYSQILYDGARENIEKFLIQIENKGKHKLFLYGAGEVAEILLHTIYSSDKTSLNILGVIDDDIGKVGGFMYNTPIISLNFVNNTEHDGILISSYTNKDNILKKLVECQYDTKKVFNFFEL